MTNKRAFTTKPNQINYIPRLSKAIPDLCIINFDREQINHTPITSKKWVMDIITD